MGTHTNILAVIVLGLLFGAQCLTVGQWIAKANCNTAVISGLSHQIVNMTDRLVPGVFKDLRGLKRVSLGEAARAVPFLQTPAANSLQAAVLAHGGDMGVNSVLRTLPQQVMLYQWWNHGHNSKCGISDAATPGKSAHEGGLAIDLSNPDFWATAMEAHHFVRLGPADPPHFTYEGPGTKEIRKITVQAFQKLWNQHNPNHKIDEDGLYGPQTLNAVLNSPDNGW